LGDEFFFIISGFYFSQAASNFDERENPFIWNFRQTIKRVRKISIPYFTTWVICFFGVRFTNIKMGGTNRFFLFDMANSVYELLFLEMLGFKKGLYSNDVAWFFSALLIACFMIGPWIAKYKKSFSLYFTPLIAVFSYGILSLNFDYLYAPGRLIANSFIMKGLIRAVAAVCVGVFLNGIVRSGNTQNYIERIGKKCKAFIGIADLFLWLIVLTYMVYPFKSRAAETWIQFDYIEVILLAAALLPVLCDLWGNVFSEKSERIACKFGRYAFYAYFGQAVFYSVDKLVYSMEAGVLTKALILNLSIPIISIILATLTTRIRESIVNSAKKRII